MSSIMEAIKSGLKLKATKASKEEAKVRKWVKKKLPKLIVKAVSEGKHIFRVRLMDVGSYNEAVVREVLEEISEVNSVFFIYDTFTNALSRLMGAGGGYIIPEVSIELKVVK